jgi:alcohol dehydrogenase class-P
MTDGGVDRSVECTGNIDAMIPAFECVHDVCTLMFPKFLFSFCCILLGNQMEHKQLVLFMLSQSFSGRVGGSPLQDAVFKTHPVNFLNGRTLKGTFFGNYKPLSDLLSVVEKYMNKVIFNLTLILLC